MKITKTVHRRSTLRVALTQAAIGWMCWNPGTPSQAQTPSTTPPTEASGLQEVVTLSRQQLGDDVILSYIRRTGKTYRLSADDLIYLNGAGVSKTVINALLQTGAASLPPAVAIPAPAPAPVAPPSVAVATPAPAPTVAPAPPAAVNFTYFHDQLAPFGRWIRVGGAWYWRPDSAIQVNPDFRPYYDMGRWVQTENGLFWQSDYVWGDIPFHYGRWVKDPGWGWLWFPEYEWGPAWVFWRHAEADLAIGWAPLPVGAVVVDGGFLWHGARVGLEFDFGLGEGCFVFVGYDHFHDDFHRWAGREYAWHIHGDRFHDFYRRSVIRNDFHRDEYGRFVNQGIGRERLEQATHGRVERASFEDRAPVGNRGALASAGKTTAAGPSKVFRDPAPAAPRPSAGSSGGSSVKHGK